MLFAFEAFWLPRIAWIVFPLVMLNTSSDGTKCARANEIGRSTWKSRFCYVGSRLLPIGSRRIVGLTPPFGSADSVCPFSRIGRLTTTAASNG